MPDRLGNAALIWSATSDASGQRVHLLQVPLRAIKAGHSMQTFQRQSLDRSVLENVAIGDGAAELRGRVRYDHDPEGLSDALVAGSQGKTLRYVPDLSDPDVDFDCDLVGPLAPFGLDLDAQRGILGDQSVELVLRQTDQSAFDPLYHGSAVLFSYRAGGSLEASSSFGRVTSTSAPATYADIDAGGGFGSLSTALSNQARIHWMSTASSVGPRTFPTLLLEGSREQLLPESEDFGSTGWVTAGSVVLTSGQTDPGQGTAAWLVEGDSTSGSGFIKAAFTAATSGTYACSVHIRQSTGDTQTMFLVSSGADAHGVFVTWSSGEPVLSVRSGSPSFESVERWSEEFWRVKFTGEISAPGTDASFHLYPTNIDVSSEVGDVFFHGAQVE